MQPDVVLLTGFPSFLARKTCEVLLTAEAQTRVHAVVPAAFEAEAREALDVFPLEQRRRVNLIEGAAHAMDLGLSGAEFRALSQEVTRIHHTAHLLDPGAERKLAEEVNLGGAREMIEFGKECPALKSLVVHSTAQVSGDRAGVVLEEELDAGQVFRNVAIETMARAERLLRRAMPSLPIVVLRPTHIVGDSVTGEIDRFEGPYFLILLIVTSPPDLSLPLPGRAEAPLHLVPIDYVAAVAHALGRDPRAVGRTFQIGDPEPLSTRRVFDLVAAAGGRRTPRGFIPANLTKALLRTPGIDRIAKSPRGFLDALTTPVTYSYANTTELLSDTGLRCPPLESYIERLVEYVQLRLREKRARAEAAEISDPLV